MDFASWLKAIGDEVLCLLAEFDMKLFTISMISFVESFEVKNAVILQSI